MSFLLVDKYKSEMTSIIKTNIVDSVSTREALPDGSLGPEMIEPEDIRPEGGWLDTEMNKRCRP